MPLIATGDPHLLCDAGLFGKEAELEKLSSNLDSERNVDTDLADPELMDPVPVIETILLRYFSTYIFTNNKLNFLQIFCNKVGSTVQLSFDLIYCSLHFCRKNVLY